MENPWTTLNKKEIYDNPWITVEEHQVINPGGGKNIYGKVSFKNYALGIIPLDEDNNTWLVGQYRYTLNEYSWEIPMGGGSISKDILSEAKRELLEETGLEAENYTQILKIHTSNSVTDEVGFIFLAESLNQKESNPEETEVDIKVKKISLLEALEMIQQGEITDSLSVAGLLMLARLKKL